VGGGVVLGTLLALARLSDNLLLSRLAKWYVNYFRSIPLLLVISWFYLVVPMVLSWITGDLTPVGAFTSCLVAFVMFEAAYFSEIVRAGIQSISRGQINAAYALGMSYSQAMRLVILPQAFRKMMPLLLQQSIILFQDTSLVYAIGAYDMLKGFETAGKNFGRPIEAYVLAAVVYFVICFALSSLVKHLHKKIAIIR